MEAITRGRWAGVEIRGLVCVFGEKAAVGWKGLEAKMLSCEHSLLRGRFHSSK
jgi:hypothetical protein